MVTVKNLGREELDSLRNRIADFGQVCWPTPFNFLDHAADISGAKAMTFGENFTKIAAKCGQSRFGPIFLAELGDVAVLKSGIYRGKLAEGVGCVLGASKNGSGYVSLAIKNGEEVQRFSTGMQCDLAVLGVQFYVEKRQSGLFVANVGAPASVQALNVKRIKSAYRFY